MSAELEAQIAEQGSKVKSMKDSGASKDEIAPEVAKLLELKGQLPDGE